MHCALSKESRMQATYIEKGLTGLTPAIIGKLQNYFGRELRANYTTIEVMQKAIWASFFHVVSNEKNNYHSHREESPSSWCQFDINKSNL